MSQITEHFSTAELGIPAGDDRLLRNAHFLCEQVLEPIRAKWGPVRIHDGYRDPLHNATVGGKTASFHLYAGGHAAADIDAHGITLPDLFNWLRLESHLPFDKVILETSDGRPACIHIQIDCLIPPRREAYTGGTGDAQIYISQPVN